jgi:hypothetical protein
MGRILGVDLFGDEGSSTYKSTCMLMYMEET